MLPFVAVAETTENHIAPLEARYRPLIELGRGGTARVYLANSLSSGLKKLVVLKTLEPELSMDVEMRELFLREAHVCARLNHPNIVQINEVLELSTGPVIVMEYLEGVALSQVISQSSGQFSTRLHLYTLTQLLAGLHYFHDLKDYDHTTELRPVHRDVSPQNVVVLYEGAVKVLDFGIAKLANQESKTSTGIVKGKLHYMPAEQLMSDASLDRRADIFAAGIMLWEALAGRRMWKGMTENAVLQALVRGELPNLRNVAPDFPDYFYDVVAKATALSPDDRYSTALDLQLELEKMLDTLGGPVRPRELATFMQAQFGTRRKEQEAAVAEAIKHPLATPWAFSTAHDVNSGSVDSRDRAKTPVQRTSGSTTTNSSFDATKPPSRTRWAGLLVLLAAATALGVFLLKGNVTNNPAASTQPSVSQPREISFAVTSNPIGALVLLDGRPLGRSPWRGAFPEEHRIAKLEIRADGHIPFSKEVSLNENVDLDVQLQRDLPTPEPEVSAKKPTPGAKSIRQGKATKVTTKGANCNPPYVLSQDGIRVYKPECF
ncbi:MAG: serine/threonine-protein kinase [Polyangiaceae bacterium]